MYKQAEELLENAHEDFLPYLKKELAQAEAAIFGNLAFCYQKEQHDSAVISYCGKVIDHAQSLGDETILFKAYTRRGLAFERTEKYREAIDDLSKVREAQSGNR